MTTSSCEQSGILVLRYNRPSTFVVLNPDREKVLGSRTVDVTRSNGLFKPFFQITVAKATLLA